MRRSFASLTAALILSTAYSAFAVRRRRLAVPHTQTSFCRIFGSWVITTPIGPRRGSGIAPPEALVLLVTAASRGPADMEPATAIAIMPAVKIDPNIAFALSHRLNARWFSGDIHL
jgi:hypothetical protein